MDRHDEMDLAERNAMEYASLRAEISQYNWMIYATTWAVLLMMAYLHTSTADNGFGVILLGIAWIHAMARYDFLMHRIGSYHRAQGSGWESSPQRNRSLWILALSDVGCALPIAYMFGSSVYALWENGFPGWAAASAFYAAFGVYLLVKAATVHKK